MVNSCSCLIRMPFSKALAIISMVNPAINQIGKKVTSVCEKLIPRNPKANRNSNFDIAPLNKEIMPMPIANHPIVLNRVTFFCVKK